MSQADGIDTSTPPARSTNRAKKARSHFTSGDFCTFVAEGRDGVRVARLDDLCKKFGVQKKTLQKWLRSLRAQGQIEVSEVGNGMHKLEWRGLPRGRSGAKGKTTPKPNLRLVSGTAVNGLSVGPSPSPSPKPRTPKKSSNDNSFGVPVPAPAKSSTEDVTTVPTVSQRPAGETAPRTEAAPGNVLAKTSELYTAPPVPTIPLVMPRRNPVLVVFAVVTALVALAFLGGAIYGGLLHAAERAADSVPALIVFAVVIVGAAVFGAIAFPAAEFMPRGWRIGLRCASVACMTYTTAMALGFAAHRYETTASERGHDAAAYAALTEDVERLRRRRDALGEPRPVEVVLADLKAASRADVCNSPKKRKSKECAEYRDKLTAEKTATESLPAIRAELAAKETAWLNTKPIASADAASAGLASVFNSFGDVVSIAGTRKGLWVYGTILGEILAALGFAAAVAMWRQSKA